MADFAYERVLCVKNEVFVYRIPPRQSNRGYRAADWKLDAPDWTGRLRVIAKGKELVMKLEDKEKGDLFAQCPVDEYPGIAVESVLDSSRYFVIRIKDEGGRSAFIGIGFADRADSFDLNVTLSDHFKGLKQDELAQDSLKELDKGPKLDLGFKEGQTITINIGGNKKSDSSKPRPRAQGGGIPGLLPPPPSAGAIKIAPPACSVSPSHKPKLISQPANPNPNSTNNVDLLFDLEPTNNPSTFQPVNNPLQSTQSTSDPWGDFTGSNTSTVTSANNISSNSSGEPWIQF
ncbi:adaptin ear-binding coat-associated protein 1 isoform X1 [Patella vulgata]|uniref:adaptin ear-binding coat-associated protein 1 isoform X1 n=1 Tax=Patella vulgata TaxID=6465 RepID=UPI0021801EF2|nr:adaptin ear-binding coat-associated protein 1 isoform X1 [Patella vulgata]